ncbi:M48 family metallopeptidase [Mucisphaera sp.]|uniref:M48 family metallopeptidase n=1 Tax=Mucisphaera sp. TaxID=2913024 RepID=UPI003D14ED82
MPIYAMALFALLLGYDSLALDTPPADATDWALSLLAKAVLALAWSMTCLRVSRSWSSSTAHRKLPTLYRFADNYGPLALILFALDLYLGTLASVRSTLGDPILLDELITLLPTFLLLTWRWVPYFPIDRWAREAGTMRRMMEGKPVYPPTTLATYVLDQTRHQLAPVLMPMLLIVAWLETLNLIDTTTTNKGLLLFAGLIAILALSAPLIIASWRTRSVPPGELRDDLTGLCQTQRVRPGHFRLWITEGRLANAAVLGILWPFRYVLITDTLLDHLPKPQILGVLAHEVAHVRQRHALWLGLGTLAVAWAGETALRLSPWADLLTAAAYGQTDETTAVVTLSLATAAVAIPWLLAMGYLSRRFERQADAAAVRALSLHNDPQANTASEQAANDMNAALNAVAELNNMSTTRFMWRHGSIRERQDHLRSLIHTPLNRFPIDQRVQTLRLLILLTAAITTATWFAFDLW